MKSKRKQNENSAPVVDSPVSVPALEPAPTPAPTPAPSQATQVNNQNVSPVSSETVIKMPLDKRRPI